MKQNRIREVRKKAGMTQEQLAKALGINRATLSRYESGDIDPPSSQFYRISNVLGVHPWELNEDVHDITEIATALAEYKGILKAILETGYLPPQLNEIISKYVPEGAEITLFNISQRLLAAKENHQTPLSDITAELLELFEQLNTAGQQKAVERVKEMTEIRRYRAETPTPKPAPTTDNPSPEN